MEVFWTGVWPRRDQVRLSGETSEKPLSSSRTRVASHWQHFFYPGQFVFLPLFNACLIPVHRLALGALATPAHPLHHMPDRTGVIANAKQLPDHLGDPIQCPIVA